MTAKINYLRPATGVATKTFKFENGVWSLSAGYKSGKIFDGFSYDVADIEAAFELIKKFSNSPMFMIHGDFIPGINLKNIVRRKLAKRADGKEPTLKDRELTFVCFDVDGYSADSTASDVAIEMFIQELPAGFWEADYIYQYSASHGLFPEQNELKVHLFFWLQEPVDINALRAWTIAYNAEKAWGKILDPQVFVATQPIYTQRRICLSASDPIAEVLGLIRKSGNLDWKPPKIEPSAAKKKVSIPDSDKYSMEDGIKKILAGESFHDEINKLSLSLMAKGIGASEIKATIRGIMMAGRENISGKRLADWEERYRDIDRSVDGAFDLVDNPHQNDLMTWIESAPIDTVVRDFPQKTFKKSGTELTEIIGKIAARSSIPKKDLRIRVKGFKEKFQLANKKNARKNIFDDRKKRNIHEVVVNKHNFAEAAEQVSVILSKSPRWPPVFFYGPALTYIDFASMITIRQMTRHNQNRLDGKSSNRMPAVVSYKKPYHDLIARMGMDIRFVKSPLGPEVTCPDKLASVVALNIAKKHRELTGIVHSPFVDEDWKIFLKRGYDPQTGLYSLIEDKAPKRFMTPAAAWFFLKDEVLAEFPFRYDLDAAVMVASMMALLQRPLLARDNAGMPGFGITAPVQSSGKTTLVNIAATVIFKTTLAANGITDDEKEFKKELLSILMQGQPCVLFDNVPQGTAVKSNELAKAMSSEVYAGRVLGFNRTVDVPSGSIWFFTGNNITFPDDLSTRVYPIYLNPKMENPDTRHFKRKNVLDWILENRREIIWALISIIITGRNLEPMETGSRFNIWDKFIRQPIFHAAGIDINAAIISNKESDMDFVNKRKLINELKTEFDAEDFTSRRVIDRGFPDENNTTEIGHILREILGDKYSKSAKSVGKMLGKMIGRAFGSLVLDRNKTDRSQWKIETIR